VRGLILGGGVLEVFPPQEAIGGNNPEQGHSHDAVEVAVVVDADFGHDQCGAIALHGFGADPNHLIHMELFINVRQ
jgi:hypothetical protein